MSNVQPESEKLRKAVQWVSEKRKQTPDINLARLVDDAGLQFDLSPKDVQFLLRFVKNGDHQNSA